MYISKDIFEHVLYSATWYSFSLYLVGDYLKALKASHIPLTITTIAANFAI
jgi:hypothetical protein